MTGAASGIGRAIAVRLAGLGYRLVLVDRDLAGLETLLSQMSAAEGHVAVAMDVSDPEAWRRLPEKLPGDADVALLVQAAGVLLAGRLCDCPLEEIQRLVQVNLTGILLGAATVGPLLSRDQSGETPLPRGVLNVASIFASVAPPGFTAYNASKAGVIAATETLRGEWAPLGLTATAVLPGVARTGLFDAAAYSDDRMRELVSRRASKSELTADRVAEGSLEAYRRRQIVAAIGGRARRYHWLKRLAPGFLLRRVAAEANRELPS